MPFSCCDGRVRCERIVSGLVTDEKNVWVRKVIQRIQNVLHPKAVEVSEEEESMADEPFVEELVVDEPFVEEPLADKPECSESVSEPSNIGSSCNSMTWLEWLTMMIWRLFGFFRVCWNGSHLD